MSYKHIGRLDFARTKEGKKCSKGYIDYKGERIYIEVFMNKDNPNFWINLDQEKMGKKEQMTMDEVASIWKGDTGQT